MVREHLGLTGTKFGCAIAAYGACTMLVDGNQARTCGLPVSAVQGRPVTTIEGLTGFLRDRPSPADAEIAAHVTNLCRCATYVRIRAAIHADAAGTRA